MGLVDRCIQRAGSLAEGCIYVPILGLQSLNVSVAAACIMHTLSHRMWSVFVTVGQPSLNGQDGKK